MTYETWVIEVSNILKFKGVKIDLENDSWEELFESSFDPKNAVDIMMGF